MAHSPETKAKIAAALKGRPSPLRGRKLGRHSRDRVERTTRAIRAAMQRPDVRANIEAAAQRPESRARKSAAKRGDRNPMRRPEVAARMVETKAQRRGEHTYRSVHELVRRRLPRDCEVCGQEPAPHRENECALRADVAIEHVRWAPDRQCWYSVDPRDYVRLCVPCHNRQEPEVRARLGDPKGRAPQISTASLTKTPWQPEKAAYGLGASAYGFPPGVRVGT